MVMMILVSKLIYGDILYCVVRYVVLYVFRLMNVVCLNDVRLFIFVSSISFSVIRL